MSAGHAQTVYDADPSRRVAICDCAGNPRWSPIWDGNPILVRPADATDEAFVHRIRNASGCRPYIHYPFTVETGWTFTSWKASDHRGRLYLTPKELRKGEHVQHNGPFVLVEPSPKPQQPNRQWPLERYRALISACLNVRFVQPIHEETVDRLPGIDHVRTHAFRETCGVLQAARAYLGPEGGLAHAAAALRVPAVVIFGGCIPVQTMGYPDHLNLADHGPGTPCGRYKPCPHCVEAMAGITVDRVAEALRTVLQAQRVAS
jgi:ADP-heptose:LPS heptosyltransferase